MRLRREALGRPIDEIAADSDISAVTWSRIEHGRTVRGLSYGAVDKSLGWAEGSAAAFLQNGTPPRTAGPVGPPDRDDMQAELMEAIRADPELAKAVHRVIFGPRAGDELGKRDR